MKNKKSHSIDSKEDRALRKTIFKAVTASKKSKKQLQF